MPGNFRPQHIQCGEPVLDRPAFDRTHAECICWFIYFLFVSARLHVFCHVICMFTSASYVLPFHLSLPFYLFRAIFPHCRSHLLPFHFPSQRHCHPVCLFQSIIFPWNQLRVLYLPNPTHNCQFPCTTAGTLTFSSSCYGVHQVDGLIHVSFRDQQHWHRKTTLWRSSLSIFLQPSRPVHFVSFVLVFSVNN